MASIFRTGMDIAVLSDISNLFFDIFFVNSDNNYGHHDLERARHVGGFIPEDRAKDDR